MRRRRRINKLLINVTSQKRIENLRPELIRIELALQKSLLSTEEHKAMKAIKRNSKYLFLHMSRNSRKSNVGPIQKENEDLTADAKEMADLLAKQYSKVFSRQPESPVDPKILFTDDKNWKLKDIKFNVDDFTVRFFQPDGFPIVVVQKCPALAYPIHKFWTSCWEKEVTVQSLKEPVVVPIHKGKSKSDPVNYRPISPTSHIIKMFEKVIRRYMVEFIEENELFNQTQHGFRIGRSCISQLLQQYDRILTIVEEGKNVDVVYIDFAKAFDKVDFKVLLEKVASLGIGGKVGRWLHTFLSNRTQRVMMNGKLSDPSAVLSGVPQGSVLGPLLFLLVIGDIDNGLGISVLSSFADDTRILAAVSNVIQASKLQQDLEVVYEWARTNKMEFNSSKFELLRYWLNDDALKYCTNYTSPSGSIIPEKDHVKDLGVTLSDDGKFNEHVRKVIVKVKNLTSWILRSFSNRSAEVMLTLWKSLVLPHT